MQILGYRLSADLWGGLLMVAGIARVVHFHFYPPQSFEHWVDNPFYYIPAGLWLALLVVARWRWGTKAWYAVGHTLERLNPTANAVG